MVRKSSSINHRNHTQTQNHSGGKKAKVVMQQTTTAIDQVKVITQQSAIDVDQVKRLSSNVISADYTLTHPSREPIARNRSQMALPSRSLDES